MSTKAVTPGLSPFLKSLRNNPIDTSIENFISLLKRRQIRHSRACATATVHLLLRVIAGSRTTEPAKLIERIQNVGHRICAAQPRELVVGNIVRRILGLIREVAEDEREGDFSQQSSDSDSRPLTPHVTDGAQPQPRPGLPSSISTFSPLRHGGIEPHDIHSHHQADAETQASHNGEHPLSRPPLLTSHTSYATGAPPVTSMFNLLSHPEVISRSTSPGSFQPSPYLLPNSKRDDLRAEVVEGIHEIIDELNQADDQIASYALDHIHQNEIILVSTASVTVQKFLLKAAQKRSFHVMHAENYPNNHKKVHSLLVPSRKRHSRRNKDDPISHEAFSKPLTQLGCQVTLIPDKAIFGVMARVNKVILGTHAVLANGGLVAAAGMLPICRAARAHKVPVVIVSGVYKLSPVYPFDSESLEEYGDSSKVIKFEEGEFMDGFGGDGNEDGIEALEVENPTLDFVPADVVDLYVTNLGGCAPSYLYRVVGDHYRGEDVNF